MHPGHKFLLQTADYLAQGLGLSVCAQINARAFDRTYKYYKTKNNGVGKPEYRLCTYVIKQLEHSNAHPFTVPVIPGTFLLPVGLLITGWCAQNRVFWLAPDIVRAVTNCLWANCLTGNGTGLRSYWRRISISLPRSTGLHD